MSAARPICPGYFLTVSARDRGCAALDAGSTDASAASRPISAAIHIGARRGAARRRRRWRSRRQSTQWAAAGERHPVDGGVSDVSAPQGATTMCVGAPRLLWLTAVCCVLCPPAAGLLCSFEDDTPCVWKWNSTLRRVSGREAERLVTSRPASMMTATTRDADNRRDGEWLPPPTGCPRAGPARRSVRRCQQFLCQLLL